MRVSGWAVPVLVVLAAAAGIGGARLFAAPSYERVFEQSVKPVRPETSRFVIRGLRCVDTARAVANQIEGTPGVLRYIAYASRNEAQVTFDAAAVDPSVIKEAIEGPVFDEQTGQILFHQYEVVSIDGNKIR